MNATEHPLWCAVDEQACDYGQPRGEHRGPIAVIDYDTGGRVELEIVQGAADFGPVLTVTEWTAARRRYPSIEWRLPLPVAKQIRTALDGLLSVDPDQSDD